jgi:hypothetical protein
VFEVETAQGPKQTFSELLTWELMSLKPSTVLEIPTRLHDEYSISPSFLRDALFKKYLVQFKGKEVLKEKYGSNPGRFLISATKHYSSLRAAASRVFAFPPSCAAALFQSLTTVA